MPSLLFPEASAPAAVANPEVVADLNLDQLFASILRGREEYDLSGVFDELLGSPDDVTFRQAVFRDLESPDVAQAVRAFAGEMRRMRGQLHESSRFHYSVQRRVRFLDAAMTYVAAVRALSERLSTLEPESDGLRECVRALSRYAASQHFAKLADDAEHAQAQMRSVRYRLRVLADRVHVSPVDDEEEDYAAAVSAAFERFRQGDVGSHLAKLSSPHEMDHVEAAIAELVARLYPDPFATLAAFCEQHAKFADELVTTFDHEVQFYLGYLEFCSRMTAAGLGVCYPVVTATDSSVLVKRAYDAALADKLVADRQPVVCNDVCLARDERIIVVTGPNQGGKTTFARMVGQLHYLAGLGVPVPAEQATLPLVDRILSHFEHGENLRDLTGKLHDDLTRIKGILDATTSRSVLVINEIFSSTSLEDAVLLGARILQKVDELGCICVCVTFLDELSTVGDHTVSMTSMVAAADPATRTFEVVRRAADGLAYAGAIAAKHRLGREQVSSRVRA